MEVKNCLQVLQKDQLVFFTGLFIHGCSSRGDIDASCWRYLQVIDVLLCVQVDATGPLLDGHDGQAHVNAAMEFTLLDLWQMSKRYLIEAHVD